jgi:ABC-2 type transport system permease protein
VFTGNVVASLLFGTTTAVQNRFIHMRVSGLLDYYATLPIRLFELIVAIVMASLLFSLPAVLTVILLGSRILSITLDPNPLVWVVIPLSTLPFAGIGALAGTTMKTIEESSTVTRIIMLGLTILGPVISPPYLLPEVILILGRFNPASYTASALRQVLIGPITTQLGLDLMAMIGFSVLSFWNVGRRIDWRRQ